MINSNENQVDRGAPLLKNINNFKADKKAAVAITFAIGISAAMILTGIGIDYSRGSSTREKLQWAADNAALAMKRTHTDLIDKVGDSAAKATAQAHAQQVFNANLETFKKGLKGERASAAYTWGAESAAIVDATGTIATSFSYFIGATEIPVKAHAEVKSGKSPVYVDIHILLDASGSMGIGATTHDQNLMQARMGCVFGCHVRDEISGGQSARNARSFGATLRFDAIKNILLRTITDISNKNGSNVRFSIYRFSNETNQMSRVTDPLYYHQYVTSILELHEPSLAGPGGRGSLPAGMGSNVQTALNYVHSTANFGTGTKENPISIVVLITDGIENSAHLFKMYKTDYPLQWTEDTDMIRHSPYFVFKIDGYSDQTMQSMQASYCTPLKNAGAKVMTLTVPYVIPPPGPNQQDIDRDNFIRYTLNPLVKINMSNCATDDTMALVASDPADIEAALKKLLVTGSTMTPYLSR